MGRRISALAGVLALVAWTPGCIAALAAAAGADARTVSEIFRGEAEIVGSILSSAAEGEVAATAAAADEGVPRAYADADHYVCRLRDGTDQLVRAHSIEGARAACLMSNDVDLVRGECACAPTR